VKVAFFGGLDTLKRVQDPLRAVGSRVRVASLVDLAGMKMRVIQVRGSWKDYADIHALVTHGIDLATGAGSSKCTRQKLRSGDEHPSAAILWRWNTGSGVGRYEARSDSLGAAN
jgi:hypothetical protein